MDGPWAEGRYAASKHAFIADRVNFRSAKSTENGGRGCEDSEFLDLKAMRGRHRKNRSQATPLRNPVVLGTRNCSQAAPVLRGGTYKIQSSASQSL